MKTTKEVQIFKEFNDNKFDDELDLKRFTAEVQDRLKGDLSADFVLAELSGQQKTGIEALHSTAEFAKKALDKIPRKAIIYYWDKKKKDWDARELDTTETQLVNFYADQTFDAYMNRLKVISILERNKSTNPLLKMLLTGATDNINNTTDKIKDKANSLKKED